MRIRREEGKPLPTSHLDNKTKKKLLQDLRRMRRAARRLATAAHARGMLQLLEDIEKASGQRLNLIEVFSLMIYAEARRQERLTATV